MRTEDSREQCTKGRRKGSKVGGKEIRRREGNRGKRRYRKEGRRGKRRYRKLCGG